MPEQKNHSNVFMSVRASLARVASRIVPPKEIEDIVQESYVRLCQVNKQDEVREPRAFLMKTVRNLALDYIKRAESRLTISVEDSSELGFDEVVDLADKTLQEVASDQEFALFCEAVRQLPVQCRRVFVLKKVYGYSQREISRKLKISESTVEKHIAMGLKRCKFFMMQREEKRGVSTKSPLVTTTFKGKKND